MGKQILIMGGCCPDKQREEDLRVKENTFKQSAPKEPEFQVLRKDSIGQAAKENTKKIIENEGRTDKEVTSFGMRNGSINDIGDVVQEQQPGKIESSCSFGADKQ